MSPQTKEYVKSLHETIDQRDERVARFRAINAELVEALEKLGSVIDLDDYPENIDGLARQLEIGDASALEDAIHSCHAALSRAEQAGKAEGRQE